MKFAVLYSNWFTNITNTNATNIQKKLIQQLAQLKQHFIAVHDIECF